MACGSLFLNELDKEHAQELILNYKTEGTVDSTLLAKSNTHTFVTNDGNFLFVVNGFKGDFNGWVYSEKPELVNMEMKIGDFTIKEIKNVEEKWIEVYGKW